MKKTLIKTTSVLLALIMLLSVAVTGVSAETSSDSVVYIAGALIEGSEEGYWLETDGKLTSDNASAENYNVKFEPATESTNAKLTLKNANLSQKADLDGDTFICCSAVVLDIEILGENTIECANYAFYLLAEAKFIGNGKLNINSGEDSIISIVSGSDVTVSDNVFIDCNTPCGIITITEENTVTIEDNANVNITGGGVSSAGLTVKDDAVLTVETAVNNHVNSRELLSVELWGDINISGNAAVNLSVINECVDETEIDTKALEIHKGNVNISDNAQFNVISSGGYESYGVYLWNGNMSVTGSAKVNVKSDNASGTAAICAESTYDPVLTVSDNASIIAQAGIDSNSPGTAIVFSEIIVSDNAVIKGVSGNNNQLEEGEEISGSRYGIYSEKLTATGCAEITGIAGKAGRESYGVFSRNATISDECKITGMSGVSEEFSVGVGFSNAVINGNSQINAESDTALKRDSIGLGSYTLDVSGNALINAKGGAVGTSNGISAGIYAGDSAKFYGSAEINATTAPDDVYDDRNCHGICAEMLSINDNVKITASGNAKYTSAGISTNEIEINGAPSITATGNYSAFNLSEYYEIFKNEDTDIFVSTDTDPENSAEWDGESVLMTYFDGSNDVVSPYKYVKIEPAEKTYTVTYYLTAGGEVYDTKTFAEGETIVHPIPETEPGIAFVEWADENGNPLPEVMGTEDIVAYAVLNVESYAVTYMVDGSVHEKYTVTYGAEVPVPDAPEKEGFIFVGWTPEIPDSMPVNDLIFIAVFERKSYALTYDVNGGSGNIAQQTGDVNYTIGSTVPFRSGYNFLGWSKNNSAASADYVPGDSIILTEDTVLYAVWAKRSYLLTESDIFSFVNSRSNFKTGTYTMTDSDFIKLTDYICKLYNAKTAATYINRLQVARSDAWGGSCFGMSMSVILNKTGQIDFVENFDPSAANMYGVARPYQNEAVQSAINYYQISQRVNGFRTTTYTIDKGNFSTGLEKLVNTVKDGNMTLLIYSWPEGCHAIVIVGYEKAEDGGHNLIAYDNRYGSKYINVYVDEGYNTCIVNGKEEAYYVEFNTNFSIFNRIDIDGPGNDMVFTSSSESIGTEIGIKLNGNITIKNAEGETLTVNNGIIGGDMEVISSYVIVNSTVDNPVVPGTLMLKVEDSDSFTFDSTADEISASLSTDECYAEVTATADEVVISEDEGIYTTGDDIEFNGWLSLNNDMGDVINFEGQGNSEVNFLYGNNDEIIVEGANDESTITVYSNLVDVDEVTFSSEYETLNISGETDNIAITASSKNDGVFDVKVAEIINTEPAIEITNPSTTQINYGDKIILHANTEIDLPEGYYIVWTANNDNFTCEVSGDGKTCTITPSSSGNTIFTVTIYDENGEIIDTDTQEMTSKAGLWQKIVAFFKNIFGLTKTILQFFKK